jgi:hypothetical protein
VNDFYINYSKPKYSVYIIHNYFFKVTYSVNIYIYIYSHGEPNELNDYNYNYNNNKKYLESAMDPQQPSLSLNVYLTSFRTISKYIFVLCNFYILLFVPRLYFAASLVRKTKKRK